MNKRKSFFNLEQYKIQIKNKKFYLSIEWLLTNENLNQEKIKINGIKIIQKQYSTFICFEKNRGTPLLEKTSTIWAKSQKEWQTFDKNVQNFLIAVTTEKIEY